MKTNIKNRIPLYRNILRDEITRDFSEVLANIESQDLNDEAAEKLLNEKLSNRTKITFKALKTFDAIADLVDDDEILTKIIWSKKSDLGIESIRDMAMKMGANELEKLFHANQIPDHFPGETKKEKEAKLVESIQTRLFTAEPTASICRLFQQDKIKLEDDNTAKALLDVLEGNPDFKLGKESIHTLLGADGVMNKVKEKIRPQVKLELKRIHRLTVIAPDPDTFSALYNNNMHSAMHIARMDEGSFIRTIGDSLGSEKAKKAHALAAGITVSNSYALMNMGEMMRGTGIKAIDDSIFAPRPNLEIDEDLANNPNVLMSIENPEEGKEPLSIPISHEALFGGATFCECKHCNSVFSPSAYFVELLEYIRHNNLGPISDPNNPGGTITTSQASDGYRGTPLEVLFWRRPDLKCLELSCENAYTVLPYIDLVNEVMESFIVHNNNTAVNGKKLQIELDVYNTNEDDETETLLAQPQHIHKKAYCILKEAVYPFTLPYHQPLDASRIFLKHLDISRYELMTSYEAYIDGRRLLSEPINQPHSVRAEKIEPLEKARIAQAQCAEYLHLTEEDHVILTKQAFAPKKYYDILDNTTHTKSTHSVRIGLKPLYQYYFDPMVAPSSSEEKTLIESLARVKDEFMPRSGLSYSEVVDLLKTRFINPYQPKGEVKSMIAWMPHFRTISQKIDNNATNLEDKYKQVVKEIINWYNFRKQYQETKDPLILESQNLPLFRDPCGNLNRLPKCLNECDVKKFVYYHLELLGNMIVLDTGLQWLREDAKIRGVLQNSISYGTINVTGEIFDNIGNLLGTIDLYDGISWVDANPFLGVVGLEVFHENKVIATFNNGVLQIIDQEYIHNILISVPIESCDISRDRLKHLDGTSLTNGDWDKLHRFIRLSNRLDLSFDKLDDIIIAINSTQVKVDPIQAIEDCIDNTATDDCDSSKVDLPNYREGAIDSVLICKIAKLKQAQDRLGLSLPHILTFWSDIQTEGKSSLYAKLFLKRNLLGLDPIFKADNRGEYLSDGAHKISEHIPALLAGLRLKQEEIVLLDRNLELNDALNLGTVSTLYRHKLMASALGISINDLLVVSDQFKFDTPTPSLFGNPFMEIDGFLDFLSKWTRLEQSSLSIEELSYIIQDQEIGKKPIGIHQVSAISLARDLVDGFKKIELDHVDINTDSLDVTELLQVLSTKLSLLYDSDQVTTMLEIVEGRKIFSTNAPPNLTGIPNASDRIHYISDGASSKVSVRGIVDNSVWNVYENASTNQEWKLSLQRLLNQQRISFKEYFGSLIEDWSNTHLTSPDAAPVEKDKINAVLSPFTIHLRDTLKKNLVLDQVASLMDLSSDLVENLLNHILKSGGVPLVAHFLEIGINTSSTPSLGFNGYLVPQTGGKYQFANQSITGNAVGKIWIDGKEIEYLPPSSPPDPSEPTNLYYSSTVTLKAGQVYRIELIGFDTDLEQVKWRIDKAPAKSISQNELMPHYLTANLGDLLRQTHEASLLVNAYDLTNAELDYISVHSGDFGDIDFNSLTLTTWLHVHDYFTTRETLSQANISLIDFFGWAKYATPRQDPGTNYLSDEAIDQLVNLTGWELDQLRTMCHPEHFNLVTLDQLSNGENLLKMHQAIEVRTKLDLPIDTLFNWAQPNSDFNYAWEVSKDIQRVVRAKYSLTDWEEVVKPLNDALRTNQRNALINYLINQKALKDWGIVDADSLFEFFLIDVQMESCMETSRIKQAISSTQLFVQRIFLDLEQPNIKNDEFDTRRKRWEWMSRYRVWEANRKVFLYPENWLRSELRDTKSEFFNELESELLQKDIDPEMVQDALKSYLYKLDEIADMKVVGIHVVFDENSTDSKKPVKRIHVFSRTRNAPFQFYYRMQQNGYWYPWKKVDVDIPSYDYEENGKIVSSGTYLTPVEWNGRLFIFFPQFIKKSQRKKGSFGGGNEKTFIEMANHKPSEHKAINYWEIKIGYSELQNNGWSKKRFSTKSIYRDFESPISTEFKYSNLERYFIGSIVKNNKVEIHVRHFLNTYLDSDANYNKTYFEFNGSDFQIKEFDSYHAHLFRQTNILSFHYDVDERIGVPGLGGSYYYTNKERVRAIIIDNNLEVFTHGFTRMLISKVNTHQFEELFSKHFWLNDNTTFGAKYSSTGQREFNELRNSYSLYNWEIFLYAPLLVAEILNGNNQFEESMKWLTYIFNPYEKGTEVERVWKFLPFQESVAISIKDFFNNLRSGVSNKEISEWRDDPFNPHLIARSRTVSYMKWIFMKYLDNILDWGDYLFRQDTIESINYATQLYILAGHILGPKPQQIPSRGKIRKQTYAGLMHKLDAFGNATVEMEMRNTYSQQTTLPIGKQGSEIMFSNLFGLTATQYFCLPHNPQLMGYWERFEDRLYKVRHCLNMKGIFRKLALFEPPIDPSLLVAARAQGLNISSVLNDLNQSVPNYRFNYLLQKAIELCNEVKSLGNALLSNIEKREGEALSLLRAQHEFGIHQLTMNIREKQLEEAEKTLDSLYESRKSPVYRLAYYLHQIGGNLDEIPDENADFMEIADRIESIVDHSGLKLIALEKEEIKKSQEALKFQLEAQSAEEIVNIMAILPNISGNVQPFGTGISVTFGGQNLSAAFSAIARAKQANSSNKSMQSSLSSRKAGFTRQLQDRIMQANLAGREIKQIDKQITAQKIRIQITEQELTNQQQQIDNAVKVQEYLKSKYTNQELYQWIGNEIKSLFYQSYKMAYELAKKVEGLYRFDRGITDTNFIKYGYWNSARDGLLSGEQLYQGLKQLEIAYQEKRGHDYEIVNRQISLRKLNPLALLALREKGLCEFNIPEELFDMDFPGQYKRRIKTVSFSIPCITGPYTSISAKARLTEHSFRNSKLSAKPYARRIAEDDDRFLTMNIPIDAVALSSAQNDGGLFELNFKDERYMPFEGAGAISKWRLELPPTTLQQFDYNTISDVILHMSYTSCEGGQKLKENAVSHLTTVLGEAESFPQYAIFDLKHDFASEWYKAMNTEGVEPSVLKVENIESRLPYLVSFKQVDFDETSIRFSYNSGDVINIADVVLDNEKLQVPISEEVKSKLEEAQKSGLNETIWCIFEYTI